MDKKVKKKGFLQNIKDYRYAYVLILPAMLLLLLFNYLPMVGITIAFKDYDVFKGFGASPWVGFKHFINVFTQPDMLGAIANTLKLSFLNLFLGMPFPIILALLFNELRFARYKKIVQTISYMPHFLSWASVVGLASAMLALDGPINELMATIVGEGYEAKNILMDADYFLPIAFLLNLWKGVGWNSVIYLAAIAGIDPSLYEAAAIDGAGKLKQAWHITVPCISQTVIVLFVMSMGSLFASNFDLVYGLQNPFTTEETEVIDTLIYRTGIQNGQYSAATAFGLSKGIITITLILTANFISKKIAQVSIW